MKDLQKGKGLKFGTTEAKGLSPYHTATVCSFFNLDAKIIPGFKGTPELGLSAARGEIDGYATSEPTILDHVNKGQIKPPLLIIDVQKSLIFPDTPSFKDLLTLSPEDERLIRNAASFKSAKGIFGPPGMPQDRLQYMRGAFDKISSNPSVIEQLKRRLQFWTAPANGMETTELVKSAMAANPTQIDQLITKYVK